MIAHFVDLYPKGRLTYQQTSFLELTTEVEVHRIDFIGKAEAHLKRGLYGKVAYYTQHPALLHYNGPLAYMTVHASKEVPTGFLAAYEQCIARATEGWRQFAPGWSGINAARQQDVSRYLRSHIRLSLIYPDFIAQQLVALCQRYQLDVTYVVRERWHPRPLKAMPPFALLCIGQSYVIARDFYVSTLTGSAYLAAGNSWR